MPDVTIGYGTAGFRAEASSLASTVFRTGVLAALRSRKTGAVTGLVITASHNPVADNGIKVRTKWTGRDASLKKHQQCTLIRFFREVCGCQWPKVGEQVGSGIAKSCHELRRDPPSGPDSLSVLSDVPSSVVQVADPDGGMLLMEWEAAATSLANAPTSEALVEVRTRSSLVPPMGFLTDKYLWPCFH